MDDQAKPDPSTAGPQGGAPAPLRPKLPAPSAVRSDDYKARRMGWIREHSSDDRFLVFVGVLVAVLLLGAVSYKLLKEFRKPPALEPVPLVALYNAAQVEELTSGVIRASYDFATDPKLSDLRETCPQLADWEVPRGTVSRVEDAEGKIANSGVLVNGLYSRYRPYFVPGDLSVECDAALIQGSQIALRLSGIEDGKEDDGYRFELWAPRAPEEPATAVITEYRQGLQIHSTAAAKLPELKARRNPPLFYHVKFEFAAGVLHGYFEGREVCQRPAGEVLPGAVMLLGPDSRTAFDNVVITGRAHPDFIQRRTNLYRLFQAPPQAPPAKRWWQF